MKHKFYVISMIVLPIFVAGLACACIIGRWELLDTLFAKIIAFGTLIIGLYEGISNILKLAKEQKMKPKFKENFSIIVDTDKEDDYTNAIQMSALHKRLQWFRYQVALLQTKTFS